MNPYKNGRTIHNRITDSKGIMDSYQKYKVSYNVWIHKDTHNHILKIHSYSYA